MERGTRWLGLVGGLLMIASLLLPSIGGVATVQGDYPAEWYVVMGLAAVALLLAFARPAWAWCPALAWLAVLPWLLARSLRIIEEWQAIDADAYLYPWPWLAAFAGGACVLAASLRARRRARPRTDNAAHDRSAAAPPR
jgi:hypothetical protein